MIDQVTSALLNNGPIGILCIVLWLQNREATKREADRQNREDDRDHRNEQIARDRITADIEMARGLTSQAEKFDAFGKMLERLVK